MNASQWFRDQLQASAAGFVWGAGQVPPERRFIQPPTGLGEWTAARHIFHMLYYERNIALPNMRQWLGEPWILTAGLDEDAAWDRGQDVESLLTRFRAVRNEQIALLSKFDDSTWNETRDTIWGSVTLFWVVSKTYQHTAEHTSNVLQIALFWDHFAAPEQVQEAG
jgi:hypothetical protein